MKRLKLFVLPLFGLVILAGGLYMLFFQRQTEEVYVEPDSSQVFQAPVDAPVTDTTTDQNPAGTGRPVQLQVLDVGISVPVKDGYYNRQTQQWTLTRDSAQYAVMTPKPNENSGMTFIYGHNRKAVFSRLLGAKKGSVAVVTTDSNQRYTYRLKYSFTTSPTDSGFLRSDGPPLLTLQTCSGANFENRTLFVYELVGVTNA